MNLRIPQNALFHRICEYGSDILLDINNSLFGMAKKFRDENYKHVSSKGEFFDYFKFEHAGFAYVHRRGSTKIA